MSWFRRKRPWNLEASARPWGDRPSIAEFLDAVPASLANSSIELPSPTKHGEIKFAAGAFDGLSREHLLTGWAASSLDELWSAFIDLLHETDDRRAARLHAASIGPIGSIAAALAQRARSAKRIDRDRARGVARWLVRRAPDAEPVKTGIVLLGVFGDREDRGTLARLARHAEFTYLATAALQELRLVDERDLWNIARDVGGWGGQALVEQLAPSRDPAIRRWILREAHNHTVMPEYVAVACADGADLAGALESDDVDAGLVDAAAVWLPSMGNPGPGMAEYRDGVRAVRAFLGLVGRFPLSLEQLIAVHTLERFVREQASAPQHSANGWTEVVRASIGARARDVLAFEGWRELVRREIDAPDKHRFHLASVAARKMGLDVWDAQFARLPTERGASSLAWAHVCDTDDSERFERVLERARAVLPLESIQTESRTAPGEEPGFEPLIDLDWIVQAAARFPGQGSDLVSIALQSAVGRNRYTAIQTLGAWGRRAEVLELVPVIRRVRDLESHPGTRQALADLLARLEVPG